MDSIRKDPTWKNKRQLVQLLMKTRIQSYDSQSSYDGYFCSQKQRPQLFLT